MTLGFGPAAQPSRFSEKIIEGNQEAADCLIPMGITSENVAKHYNISRRTQDEFAAASFVKAAKAQKAGKFVSEIVPVTTKVVDPKTEEEKEIVVDADDGIRDGVTADSLGKLKPAFKKDGSTHAGEPEPFVFVLYTFGLSAVMYRQCLPSVRRRSSSSPCPSISRETPRPPHRWQIHHRSRRRRAT